ncbi:hypothetical protein GGS24DRAFT_454704 [Hypoxylon argillaceum]|nr:hypothetical protein GGS24DRAFT_454704 [Hypoxylon argillaceum]
MIEPTAEPPSRIFIACVRCKARKRRCDGNTPKCSNCVTHNTECNYAAVRRTRGPGKKDKTAAIEEQETHERCDTNDTPNNANQSFANGTSPPSASKSSSEHLPPIDLNATKPLSIFPEFLLSKSFPDIVRAFKSEIKEATSRGEFSPLMPQHISKPLIENSFTDIMPEPPFITRRIFMQLFEAQYADDIASPGQDPARWALVNGVIALAGRSKIAPGAEAEMSPIMMSFYRNATLVLHQVIGQDPSLLSAQALLVLAIFARGIPDVEAFVKLTSCACNQLEILERKWSLTIPVVTLAHKELFVRAYRFASQLGQETYQAM